MILRRMLDPNHLATGKRVFNSLMICFMILVVDVERQCQSPS